MKLKDNLTFLICALCVFFPIGLIFLILSDKRPWQKTVLSLMGAAVFAALLLPALIRSEAPIDPDAFEIIATRKTLTVGQSGGLAVANDTVYHTDFQVSPENECLEVKDNIYTAAKEGTCILTVSFRDQVRQIAITVTDGERTDETVYASPTGERYHANKKHGGKNAVQMTEEEALCSNKTPCKICWE